MKTDDELKVIAQEAARIRLFLERCDQEDPPVGLEDFPIGACLEACLILAHHLENVQAGAGGWELVRGWFRKGEAPASSHAWLENKGLIVDITADQFGCGHSPVTVTRDHSWHSRFEEEGRESAALEDFEELKGDVLRVYACLSQPVEEQTR